MSLLRGCVFLLLFIISAAKVTTTHNVSGERCEWEGKNGTCISYWTCLTNAVDAVVYKKRLPVCDVRDGEEYTSCTGCDLVANISSIVIIPKYGFFLQRTGSKSYDQCIRYMQENVYPCYDKLRFNNVEKIHNMKCYSTYHGRYTQFVSGGRDASREEFPHMVTVNRLNESVCSEYYEQSRTLAEGYDHKTQLCYGDLYEDTCEGDSGGPLQLVQCRHVVIGVTSAGHPCGFPGGAGLYTRVGKYLPWIESIVWP